MTIGGETSTFNTYLEPFRAFGRICVDEENVDLSLLLHGEWEAKVAEGVKGHGDLGAIGTIDGGLEEAVEQV